MLRDELSIDNQWEKIVESLKEVAQEVVGYSRKKKEQWISESTWDIIDQRAEAKILVDRHEHNRTCTREYLDDLKAQYKRLNKQVKTRTRNDKRVFLETMADQAEVAARRGDSRTVYAITKELAGISKASSTQVSRSGYWCVCPLVYMVVRALSSIIRISFDAIFQEAMLFTFEIVPTLSLG
ncbi:hypothetical protein QYM36_018540 [Artemia franciscana]|uniref:Uncharacterized protein n=1 Tax=Artemia franciscana TaxID=6661 RepID=A0AA88KUH4_ARTSF|nr:hypothetical protein QYM36_018540 [Artemia franciscana]